MLEVRIQAQAIGVNDGGTPGEDVFRAEVAGRSRFVPIFRGGIYFTIAGRIATFAVLMLVVFGGGSPPSADRHLVEVSTVAGAMFEAGVTETGFDGTASNAPSSGSASYRHPEGALNLEPSGEVAERVWRNDCPVPSPKRAFA
ncbi:hypothetical protein D3C72_970990 [compost metagenome]